MEIVNTLWQRAEAGETVFYDIYTEAEKAQDPDKADTGLFFFKGEAGGALCRLQRGRRLCLRRGHAGQLPPRAGALQARLQTPCPDLPPRRADRLRGPGPRHRLDLCPRRGAGGGHGGLFPLGRIGRRARMAAWLGSYGPGAFGEEDLPRPAAVVPAVHGACGVPRRRTRPPLPAWARSDWIANWRTMERRLQALQDLGIPTEFHHYPGLPHGFGLGHRDGRRGLAGRGGSPSGRRRERRNPDEIKWIFWRKGSAFP